MKKASVVFLLLISSALAHANSAVEAPFGLSWGETVSELESKGVTFDECTSNGPITTCKTSSPIKPVSFGELYLLIFDAKSGLHKVALVSTNITGDITGSSGKELYGKVKTSLSNKYGEPTQYEYTGNELYDEYDEFYQCLMYDGCGTWASFWSIENGGVVMIELKGLSRGTGYLNMAYESAKWPNIVDRINKEKSQSDMDAL